MGTSVRRPCSVWLRALGTAALIPQKYTAGAGRGCQRNSSWTSIARPRLPIRPDVPNVHVEYLFIVKRWGGGNLLKHLKKTQATLRLWYLNKKLVKCQNMWDPVGQQWPLGKAATVTFCTDPASPPGGACPVETLRRGDFLVCPHVHHYKTNFPTKI